MLAQQRVRSLDDVRFKRCSTWSSRAGALLCVLTTIPAAAVDKITVVALFTDKAMVKIDGSKGCSARAKRAPRV